MQQGFSTAGGGQSRRFVRRTVPGAPGNLTVVGGNGEVVLTWDAPASDGGSAITDYEYRIASELCGQVAKIKPSYTISETSRRAEVSPLSGRLGGGGGRSTVAV